jgi:hypothetical protein
VLAGWGHLPHLASVDATAGGRTTLYLLPGGAAGVTWAGMRQGRDLDAGLLGRLVGWTGAETGVKSRYLAGRASISPVKAH